MGRYAIVGLFITNIFIHLWRNLCTSVDLYPQLMGVLHGTWRIGLRGAFVLTALARNFWQLVIPDKHEIFHCFVFLGLVKSRKSKIFYFTTFMLKIIVGNWLFDPVK